MTSPFPDVVSRMQQQVQHWRAGEHVVIALTGQLDHHAVAHVRPVLTRLIEDHHPPRVIVDLSGVELCDSSGLGMLVDATKRATAAGGSLALTGVGDRVARTLTTTGLGRVLPTYPTLDDATNHPGDT